MIDDTKPTHFADAPRSAPHAAVEPDAVVEVRSLSRKFGATDALTEVSLTIPRGVVFGLVGTNGAGKTTLIKHAIGLLRAQRGSVRVFGLDPVSNPTAVLSRIGYLSEVTELPEWMQVDELIRFTRTFYPNWDESYAESLRQAFELDPHKKVQQLSKGQRARLGLVLALSHRAELLILDEPSSGLDPLVRRDILRAIIKTIAQEGRTVLFSSHLLEEVERVADHVAILEGGRLIQNDALDSLKSRYHRLVFRFDSTAQQPPQVAGLFNWQGADRHWSAYFQGEPHEAEQLSTRLNAQLVECTSPSLNEIFLALLGSKHEPGERM
jgi:ABC-2 type transport system ATP-binding protein